MRLERYYKKQTMDKTKILKLKESATTTIVDINPRTIHIIGPEFVPTMVKDHSQLENLDYDSSGHTGFASSEDLVCYVEIESLEDVISEENLAILKKNYGAPIVYNKAAYYLTSRNGTTWSYVYIDAATGDIKTLLLNTTSGEISLQSANPVQTNLTTHINDTSVHLQAGERVAWNDKITAKVDVTEEQLILTKEVQNV